MIRGEKKQKKNLKNGKRNDKIRNWAIATQEGKYACTIHVHVHTIHIIQTPGRVPLGCSEEKEEGVFTTLRVRLRQRRRENKKQKKHNFFSKRPKKNPVNNGRKGCWGGRGGGDELSTLP